MNLVLSIDPGKATGFVVWSDALLVRCGVADPDLLVVGTYDVVVIEKPQVYRTGKRTGDPNDLIDLAVLVGRFAERAHPARVELPRPHDWKGSIKKEIHHPRILASLHAEELAIVHGVKCAASLRHNLIDAVGLGLWLLAREGWR